MQGGSGIDVVGTGSPGSPYVVSATGNLALGFIVNDTPTLDLTLVGNGLPTDPFILSGNVDMELQSLSDVASAPPQDGYVPTWDTDHWEFQPKTTAAPGAITAHEGISGDGSALNPLKAEVAGVWGTGSLANLGPDDTVGLPIYLDTNGQLRAAPVKNPALPPPLPVALQESLPRPDNGGAGKLFKTDKTTDPLSNYGNPLRFTNPSPDFGILVRAQYSGWLSFPRGKTGTCYIDIHQTHSANVKSIQNKPMVYGEHQAASYSQKYLSDFAAKYYYIPPSGYVECQVKMWCHSGLFNLALVNYSVLSIMPISWTESSAALVDEVDPSETDPVIP